VHLVLQGKGGIGKTLVASLIAQFLREHDRTPVCFDTDPVNASLAAFAALEAQPVDLLTGDVINVEAVDDMVERILKADADVVMDNGAASFIPLARYLVSDNIAELIEAAGKALVVHVILVGSGGAMETAKGLDTVLTQFSSSVRVVVWINEFFGPVAIDGTPVEDSRFFADNRDRLTSIIRLRRQNPLTTGLNLGQMLERKLTFAEALTDPAFFTVPRQRLTMYRRQVWDQLAAAVL
jgi:hypothetical protein